MKFRIYAAFTFLSIMFIIQSCKKGWIDDKPLQSLAVPDNLNDLSALLDNASIFNMSQPNLSEAGADNYYLTDQLYNPRNQTDRNVYTWSADKDFYAGRSPLDWEQQYKVVFYSNTILEQIEKIESDNINYSTWARIKGSALFHRAYAFYNLAQLFAKPYSESTAGSDLGIILRTASNINVKSERATVKQTYDQILSDLIEAKSLLPTLPAIKSNPSKHAVFAMLARTYLSMERYDDALAAADSSLNISGALLNFNSLSQTSTVPIAKYNSETIFYTTPEYNLLLPARNGVSIVDTILFNSYDANDLRKTIFFKIISGRRVFTGNYTTSNTLFSGLANDEIYLIKAECDARKGNSTQAMNTLNTLLQTRWKNTAWVPFTATDGEDALKKVINERRKELCYRCIRWTDLRRLNKDPKFQVTLHRLINNQSYTLPPNDNRYVYPIPNSEILYSSIQQNPR